VDVFWQFVKKRFRKQLLNGFLFIIFGLLIIFILSRFTDFPKVVRLILATPGRLNLLIFLFLATYYFLKFWLERFLILRLGLPVTGKRIALLFAVAELVREFPTVPIVMAISATTKEGEKFFPMRLFSALVPQLPLEIAACFLILALFGFGDLPYLQLAALVVVVGIFIFLSLLKKIPIPQFLTKAKKGLRKKIGKVLLDFQQGLELILTWKTLIVSFFAILFYFLSLATVLFFVGLASGFESLSVTQAWSSFALIYLAIVFSPIPADWGVSETAGFVLLSFLGAERESALASMLTFRIIFSSTTWFVSGAIFLFLWSEIKAFLLGFVKSGKY
jgi:uncharacterized membrane protein YbhN (UPF0104 family)